MIGSRNRADVRVKYARIKLIRRYLRQAGDGLRVMAVPVTAGSAQAGGGIVDLPNWNVPVPQPA